MSDAVSRVPEGREKHWAKVVASLLALVGTFWIVGAGPVLARLRELDVAWLIVALAITVLQFVLLAARWWFVALRLGVPMAYRRALGEYYLSVFLNNVLPFGVLGDALRAVRHAGRAAVERDRGPIARVVLAMLIERTSGQIALWLVALAVAPYLWRAASLATSAGATVQVVAAVTLAALAIGAWVFARPSLSRARAALREGGQVLFGPANMLVHVPISLALVASHVALFVVAARAIGLDLALDSAIRIVPAVLVAATLPALFGGFGTREAAAAGLYQLTGLRAADGATTSLVYGGVALLASVPGILTLPWRPPRDTPRT